MIIINDKEYTNYDIDISFQDFWHKINGKDTFGIAPFLNFSLTDSSIGLEFCVSNEKLLESKINIKTNIKKYLSDITYEDRKGWISLVDETYDCYLERINEKVFNLDFFVKSDELNIEIKTNIELL